MIQRTKAVMWSLLAFLALIRVTDSFPAPFKIDDSHLTAKEGSCITITCTVTRFVYAYEAQWFWMKNAKWNASTRDYAGTIIYSNTQKRPASSEFANRVEYIGSTNPRMTKQCSVIISNLQKSDSGNYSFRYDGLSNKRKWLTHPQLNLTVQENPCQINFEHPPKMKEHEQVILRCSTSSSCASYPEFIGLNEMVQPQQKNEINHKDTTVNFTVNWQDDGKVLSCRPHGSEDKCLARSVTLTVEYAPTETLASVSSSNVEKGNSVTLTCSSRGRPNILISWYKDGQHTARGTELKLYSITATQSGKYQCQAENKHGTDRSNVLHIDVKYAPVGVSITTDEPTAGVKEGDRLTLNCTVKESNPPPQYSWYKDRKPIECTSRRLDLPSIQRGNSGVYKCRAYNIVGSSTSPERQIVVQYSPRNTKMSMSRYSYNNQVKVNNSLTFTCHTDACPVPWSYSWYHRGGRDDPSQWKHNMTDQETLSLEHVEVTDDGCYMCSATNSIGKGKNSSHLCIRILYGPTKPVLLMVPEAREGYLITIGCSVQSFPVSQLNLAWTSKSNPRSSRRLPSRYGSSYSNALQVSFNVTSTQAGLYTCSAQNSEGSSSTTKELVVTYSPQNVTVLAKPGTVMAENGQLVLNCSARSNPRATSFNWTKTTTGKAQTVGGQQIFTITSLIPSDSGLYSCAAGNDIGTGKSQEVEVKVKYAPKHTEIIDLTSGSHHDGRSPVVLSCISHSYPPINDYKWYRTMEDTSEDKFVSNRQNITVHPDQPGTYSCSASNEIAGKQSDSVKLFLDRGFMQTLPLILSFLIALLALVLIFLVYRHKRNKSVQQGTSNILPCWCCFGFLGWRNGTRENLMSESVLAEPHRSRDYLMPDDPYRPEPQPCRPSPDSTSVSNIHTVYSALSMPFGNQCHPPSQPIGEQDGHTKDDAVNYASLHFGDQEKNKQGPKEKLGEDGVYAKVAKPQPHRKGKLEDYKNIKAAHVAQYPMPSNSDAETSEEDLKLNYSEVSFKAKPGHRRAHRDHHRCNRGHGSSDEEDYMTQYSEVKI